MQVNQEFLIEMFFTYCKRPTHKRYQNVFNAECPVCKEGKSSGRMRRLFYFPNKQYLYCHNCSRSWKPLDWIREVSGLTLPEILKKNREKSPEQAKHTAPKFVERQASPTVSIPDLPEDSIDLTDAAQLNYYKDNNTVQVALQYCIERRLFTAANTCKKFYISLNDPVHKHRLVIPFYSEDNKITCYQSRALSRDQFPRYLTKLGEKDIFNLNNIVPEIPYLFVFEGPIDSMFVKNGVAIAALSPTEKQLNTLRGLIGFELIYVFDNDKNNPQTAKKIEKQIKEGKRIFVWPKELSKFKDVNELCCHLGTDELPWQFIVKHSHSGISALLKNSVSR